MKFEINEENSAVENMKRINCEEQVKRLAFAFKKNCVQRFAKAVMREAVGHRELIERFGGKPCR